MLLPQKHPCADKLDNTLDQRGDDQTRCGDEGGEDDGILQPDEYYKHEDSMG